MKYEAVDSWSFRDRGRRAPSSQLDSRPTDVHSALVPPGALHQRVTAALANWQLDDAEDLLADVERDPSPYVASGPASISVSDPCLNRMAIAR